MRLKHGTQIGPVVDEDQLAQDLKYLDIGRNEGAELAWGGERLNRDTKGHYLQPALFVNTKNDMRINREEIFGPIASVIKVDDYDEALAIANDTAFGLSSGIFTTSLKTGAISASIARREWSWSICRPPASTITCPSAAAKARATARASRAARRSNSSPPRARTMFCRVNFVSHARA